jgi:probable H4MPT-linked C1 transfer pathway protein
MNRCIGWDVGGVNLKAVAITEAGGVTSLERPFEIWRDPDSLSARLADMGAELGGSPLHGLTMTAELSDCFATKRAGVAAVVNAAVSAFPADRLRVFGTRGFLAPEAARLRHLDVAGANWCAAAAFLARELPEGGVLLDVGSTTTDVIPFTGGRVVARGLTDTERLLAGELVYTGVLRTPLSALLPTAPLGDRECPVAAEHFAIAADAHLWLENLTPAEYTCPTPDGRAATRAGAAARLARLVCADLESLGEAGVTAIARQVAERQVAEIAGALGRIIAGLRSLRPKNSGFPRVFTAGSGAWLGEAAARRVGAAFEPLVARIGMVARVLPAYAVARLALRIDEDESHSWLAERLETTSFPVVVVKVGGSLAREPGALARALQALAGARPRPLVVPGGGPFADAVRRVHAGGGLSEETAHRMALHALGQSALWMQELALQSGPALVVRSPEEVARAVEAGALPILASAEWLAHAEALPASWDVTSDSIAAWVAGKIGARRLLLLKSFALESSRVEAENLGDAVDAHFARALPPGVECRLMDGRDLSLVRAALAGEPGAGTLVVHERADTLETDGRAGWPLVAGLAVRERRVRA